MRQAKLRKVPSGSAPRVCELQLLGGKELSEWSICVLEHAVILIWKFAKETADRDPLPYFGRGW